MEPLRPKAAESVRKGLCFLAVSGKIGRLSCSIVYPDALPYLAFAVPPEYTLFSL
jgi:hypothetical protein